MKAKAKIEVSDLLRRLLTLEKTEGDADSEANPVKTRGARVLAIRQRVVKALAQGHARK